MNFAGAAGLLIVMLMILPGGIGDIVMRFWHGSSAPDNDFTRLLRAVTWSSLALGLVELGNAAFTEDKFGDFLLLPISSLDAGVRSDAGGLALHWTIYVLVAILIPWLTRFAATPAVEKMTKKTMERPEIDSLTRVADKYNGKSVYLRIELDKGEIVEGWLRWQSTGLSGDSASVIVKGRGTKTMTLVRMSTVRSMTALDSGLIHGPPLFAARGWHTDPSDSAQLRYWSGSEWTSHVHS